MTFSSGNGMPDTYRGGAFVGEHGSWNRHEFNGYKVVYIPFKDGKPSGKPQDVVTGFLTGDNKARGRPVGLALDKSGALLVADDVGNTIWKVSASNP
jgi:glucose/arabinose dehydrogenase